MRSRIDELTLLYEETLLLETLRAVIIGMAAGSGKLVRHNHLNKVLKKSGFDVHLPTQLYKLARQDILSEMPVTTSLVVCADGVPGEGYFSACGFVGETANARWIEELKKFEWLNITWT